ncbi:hypothetical protein PanWU01x14_224320 [Parasponia andersonii]|uniref:Uncharacterized protein n=1 Tax=Parasponia andersonii TaxID=3476 RepID=A0A2P5BN57_PARAD|nr:hypothetical protein PanWU01x14_224320 [Parasponia andersonii]
MNLSIREMGAVVGPIPEPRTVRRVMRIARDPTIGIPKGLLSRNSDPRLNCRRDQKPQGSSDPKGLLSRNSDPRLNCRRDQKPQGSSDWMQWKTAPRLRTRTGHLMRFWIEKNTVDDERTTYMKATHSKEHRRVFAGSHPRLSDPAWSSEICELARAREQLENPASAVQDTWTTGVKPLQHYVCNHTK